VISNLVESKHIIRM